MHIKKEGLWHFVASFIVLPFQQVGLRDREKVQKLRKHSDSV